MWADERARRVEEGRGAVRLAADGRPGCSGCCGSAQLGSNVGTWMQTVGAQWLLVHEPGAETLVPLVQTAAMLPVMLLSLPAGELADIMDRRRLLIESRRAWPSPRPSWRRSPRWAR